jgi:tetratricopeptide (TPR) repeat protein
MVRLAALTAPLLVWAAAAHADEWTDCNSSKPDRAVRGCSVIIQSKNATPDQLAAAHLRRGSAYVRTGSLDQAIADFDEAIRLKPDDVEAYHLRSKAHSKRGERDKAIADLRKVGSILDERIKRWQPRMEKRRQIGVVGVPITDEQDGCFADSERAIRECSLIIERAGATAKQLADAHFTRGVAHHLKLEFGQAIADYGQTIRLSRTTRWPTSTAAPPIAKPASSTKRSWIVMRPSAWRRMTMRPTSFEALLTSKRGCPIKRKPTATGGSRSRKRKATASGQLTTFSRSQ